jgi:peptidoglycan/xylan/chitin deacetylase (PgdA/CDA1 family)
VTGRRTLSIWQRLAAAVAVLVFVTGCATGAPSVIYDDTPTPLPTETTAALPPTAPTSAPTATKEPVDEATAEPSPTDEPTEEPTEEPTAEPSPTEEDAATRPDPPEQDGSGLSQVYERGESGRHEVALTFDAGGDRGFAEEILDTLKEYGVIASFGITGDWASQNPDLVQRMVGDGHMVFNHTWSHRSFTGYSTKGWDDGITDPDEQIDEIDRTENEIRDLTGYDTAPYFRPPYGDLDDDVLQTVADAGYWITVMWSCDSLGWNGATVDEIIEKCGDNAENGDIILLHVGSDSTDHDALPGLIESLQASGFDFVTVEQLLQP